MGKTKTLRNEALLERAPKLRDADHPTETSETPIAEAPTNIIPIDPMEDNPEKLKFSSQMLAEPEKADKKQLSRAAEVRRQAIELY